MKRPTERQLIDSIATSLAFMAESFRAQTAILTGIRDRLPIPAGRGRAARVVHVGRATYADADKTPQATGAEVPGLRRSARTTTNEGQ
jgi:hypothetical protein